MLASMASQRVPEDELAPIDLIPPFGPIGAELRPAGSVSWVDDTGYYVHSSSPFPGAMLMSPELFRSQSHGSHSQDR